MYLDGKKVGTQEATTVPDDIALELKIFIENKGTVANHLVVDYRFQSKQSNKDNN